jgi:hypothetical protein
MDLQDHDSQHLILINVETTRLNGNLDGDVCMTPSKGLHSMNYDTIKQSLRI